MTFYKRSTGVTGRSFPTLTANLVMRSFVTMSLDRICYWREGTGDSLPEARLEPIVELVVYVRLEFLTLP
jgi:hypothetical protein